MVLISSCLSSGCSLRTHNWARTSNSCISCCTEWNICM